MQAAYPAGTIFSQLVHLELCTCAPRWWDLLTRLIEDSPKLRVLKLRQVHQYKPTFCYSVSFLFVFSFDCTERALEFL